MSPHPATAVGIAKPQISTGGGGADITTVQQSGDMHFDCTSITTSGGAVTEFIDKRNSANRLTQAGGSLQVAAPTVDASMNNQLTCTFSADVYLSNQPNSFWAFAHNGNPGVEMFLIFVPTNATANQSWIYSSWNTGMDIGALGANSYFYIGNGGTPVAQSQVAHGMVTGTPTYFAWSYASSASPSWTWRRKSTVLASGAQGTAPSTAASTETMRIGWDGASYMQVRFAAWLVFQRVLSTGDRATVQSWIQSTYGIAP